jgi:hypothetical protein
MAYIGHTPESRHPSISYPLNYPVCVVLEAHTDRRRINPQITRKQFFKKSEIKQYKSN